MVTLQISVERLCDGDLLLAAGRIHEDWQPIAATTVRVGI